MNLWSWALHTQSIHLWLGLRSSCMRASLFWWLAPHSQSHCWKHRCNVSYLGLQPEFLLRIFFWGVGAPCLCSPKALFWKSIFGGFTIHKNWSFENSHSFLPMGSQGRPVLLKWRTTSPPGRIPNINWDYFSQKLRKHPSTGPEWPLPAERHVILGPTQHPG